MKLNEIQLAESDGFLKGSQIKVFLLTQIGVEIKGKYEIVDDRLNVLSGDVEIRTLRTEKLPFKFGFVKGNFTVRDCPRLKSLEGCPDDVRHLIIKDLPALESLHGCSDKVWSINLHRLPKIMTLHGMPKNITSNGTIGIDNMKIASLDGMPNYKSVGTLTLTDNLELSDIRNLPQKINDFRFNYGNPKITSLEGISEHLKFVESINFPIFQIKYAAMGITQIGLGWYAEKFIRDKALVNKGWKIIARYLGQPDSIFELQTELIEKGFEDLAQI